MTTERGADPWSGIPDDLRKLVEDYGRGEWRQSSCTDTEASLCVALRALVADRERLQRLIVWFSFKDTFEGSGVRDWEDEDDARKAIDEGHFGATPRGAPK